MEHQQTVTVLLVLALNVIAWIAGYSTGHKKGHYQGIEQMGDALLSMGATKEEVSAVLDKALERIDEQYSKQKTPTDE